MSSLITFFLKLLTDKITSKWVWIFLLAVGLPYALKLASPQSFNLFASAVLQSITIIEVQWVRMVCFLIVVIAVFLLLRKSDSEFKKELEEQYPKYRKYKSRGSKFIQIFVIENIHCVEGKTLKRRKISVNNTLETRINFVKGKITFFEDDVKVFEVPFEEYNIPVYKGAYISDEAVSISDTRWVWDEFRVHLDRLDYEGNIIENMNLYGLSFIRNSAWILSRYNYTIFGIIRFRYELSWLGNQWDWYVRPWLLNSPRLPRIYLPYGGNLPLREKVKYYVARLLNQMKWISIVAPACVFLYLAFSGFVLISWELVVVWLDFSRELFIKLYF